MQMSWYDKNELLAEVDLAKVYPSLGLGWFSFFFFLTNEFGKRVAYQGMGPQAAGVR